MNALIFYTYNDMVSLIINALGLFKDENRFLGFLNSKQTLKITIDPAASSIFFQASKVISPILVNNLLVLFSLILSVVSCWFLFNKLKSKGIALIFSLLFSLCNYFVFRVLSMTPGLYFIFIFPFIIYLLNKETKVQFITLLVFVSLSLSIYYGFFSFFIAVFWFLSSFVLGKISFTAFINKILSLSLLMLLGASIFFGSTLINNIPAFGRYVIPSTQDIEKGVYRVYRPLEDWYNLSFRPWYFLVPPKSSIFFVEFSKKIYNKIESTNYYLANDYMEEEMAGSYMGWHFILGMVVVATVLLLKKFKNKEFPVFVSIYENKEMIVRSFFMIFLILLISGPPSFTVRGTEIYTPTYILYYIIPVFRTLVRWAVVIYLFVLIINAYLMQDLYNLMKKTWQKTVFLSAFLSLNLVIFAVRIPIININNPPQEIAFLKKEFPGSVPYAVYPKGDYYSIFWILSHEDLLINPVNFVNYETGFDSNEFSKKLITKEGITTFLSNKPKYLVYYDSNIFDSDFEKIRKLNLVINSREDILTFFTSNFGSPIFAQNNIFVYKVETN